VVDRRRERGDALRRESHREPLRRNFNVRFVAAVAAGQPLAATVGVGASAELGAIRISGEIDALGVTTIRSIAYLASTRVVPGLIVIIPLYGLAVTLAFRSAQVTTILRYGQSAGAYNHYFHTLVPLGDVRGPVDVGEAGGRSMRFSPISVVVVPLFTVLALYGVNPHFALTVSPP
jgi:phospholipid/cholesterol/gamma-HCH transport system permease protein